MELEELLTIAKNEPFERFELRLNDFLRYKSEFKNISGENKKIVLSLIKKHLSDIRNGIGISDYVIRQEMYKLHEDRLKLGLSEDDLEDIKEILNLFKK